MDKETVFKIILDCAFQVHTNLGPGLLESAYEECLFYELKKKGLGVHKQKPMPLTYKEIKFDTGFRIDLYVENDIVVEVKSVGAFDDIHMAQILTYMKLANSRLGLLVNFNVKHLKYGIKRVIL